jgi:hypothetical protein
VGLRARFSGRISGGQVAPIFSDLCIGDVLCQH